jgi:hypothetical protein
MTRSTISSAFARRLIWTIALVLAACVVAYATTKARPPKPEQLAGVWVGFDEDDLTFTRLDLRSDFSGYCARVSPTNIVLHEYGVAGYRVAKWSLDEWKFSSTLTPGTTNAEPIFLRGRLSVSSLRLEVGGTKLKWTRNVILYRESLSAGANAETKDKIGELEKQ